MEPACGASNMSSDRVDLMACCYGCSRYYCRTSFITPETAVSRSISLYARRFVPFCSFMHPIQDLMCFKPIIFSYRDALLLYHSPIPCHHSSVLYSTFTSLELGFPFEDCGSLYLDYLDDPFRLSNQPDKPDFYNLSNGTMSNRAKPDQAKKPRWG